MAENKFTIEVRAKGFGTVESQVKKSDKALKDFGETARRQRRATRNLERAIGAIRNQFLLFAFATAGATKAIGGLVNASSRFESVKTRLVGLTGSVEKAESAFDKFNKVAATTPFTLDDVVNAGAQLEAFGANSQLLLKEITDLAAFMGTTATEAANSFGRAFAGGAGAADILRERGILNIIKDSQGLEDLSKTTLPEFRRALIESLRDPAVGIEGSTDRLADTFEGAFSNMKDAVTILAVEIGDTLMPSIRKATEGIGSLAKSATTFIRQLKGEVALANATFGEGIDNILVPALAEFRFQVENLELEQLESKLKDLESAVKNSAPAVIKLANSEKELKKSSQELEEVQLNVLTSLNNIIMPGENASKALITVGDATKETQETLKNILPTLGEFIQKESEAATKTVATTEVTEENTEFLVRQVAILKELIKLKQEENQLLEDKPKEKKPVDEEDEILRQAKAFKRFSDQLAKAVVEGQKLEDAVVNSLRAIGAELVAQAASFAILNVLTSGGLKASKAGFDLLGAIFPKLGHTGGNITKKGVQTFANGGAVRGRDDVPILAQAGEFIIKRDSAQSIGLDTLNQINETGQTGSLTVNISAPLVDETVVDTIIPAIQKASRFNLA